MNADDSQVTPTWNYAVAESRPGKRLTPLTTYRLRNGRVQSSVRWHSSDTPPDDNPRNATPSALEPSNIVDRERPVWLGSGAPGGDDSRQGERGDRRDRDERRERPERGERGERRDRDERRERPERRDRDERREHGDRRDRDERRERPERGDRSERRERPERGDHGERRERGDRRDRDERREHGERGERRERPERGERPFGHSDREARAAAPTGVDERPPLRADAPTDRAAPRPTAAPAPAPSAAAAPAAPAPVPPTQAAPAARPARPAPPPRPSSDKPAAVRPMAANESADVSVVVVLGPLAPSLDDLLARLLRQRMLYPFEVVALEAGAPPAAIDSLRRAGVRTVTLAHGALGPAELLAAGFGETVGEVVVFLDERTTPDDDGWLDQLSGLLLEEPQLAVCHGRTLPAPGAAAPGAQAFAAGLPAGDGPVFFGGGEPLPAGLVAARLTNVAYRRSAWEHHGRGRHDLAAWAQAARGAGLREGYQPRAVAHAALPERFVDRVRADFQVGRREAQGSGRDAWREPVTLARELAADVSGVSGAGPAGALRQTAEAVARRLARSAGRLLGRFGRRSE